MTAHGAHDTPSLAGQIRQGTGLNAARCYQCGKCSAGCPMAEEMTLRPHDLMRLIAGGEEARLMEDDSMWLCLTCETCSARCPNECEPARVIDALREIALRTRPRELPRAIAAFHKSFLRQIKSQGRLFELGLVLGYKLSGGPLFADMTAAPAMLKRGKLALTPRTIKDVAEVQAIFRACEARKEEA